MSLSRRRSCTIPKPKSSRSNKPAVFRPSYDTQYIKRFLEIWNQGKGDKKASQAFVNLHSTCERHACKARPRSCILYKDGISCTTCQNMGRKCPRLRAFLLHYVAVHLGVSSRKAQDLYGRYVQNRSERPTYDNGGENGGSRETNGKRRVTGPEHDVEDSSDWNSEEAFTEELLSDDPMSLDPPVDEEVPLGDDGPMKERKKMKDNHAATAVEQLCAIKKRISELEAELAKTRQENVVLSEREKRYTLKAIAAENRPQPIPSPEVLERALETELMKRKEIYREELLKEWNRVGDQGSGRTSEQRRTYDKNPSTTAHIMVPTGSVALHAAVNGFVEALGLDEATPRVLDLLQWVTEVSNTVDEMDVGGKSLSLVVPQGGAPQKRPVTDDNPRVGFSDKRQRVNGAGRIESDAML